MKQKRAATHAAIRVLAVLAAWQAVPAGSQVGEGEAEASPATPYLLPTENALMRCQVPEFLACIDLDRPACEAAISKAVDEANVEIEAEVQKTGIEQTKTAFFQGKTYGILIRHMQRETKGKFLGCLTKQGKR
jgi:hypothetical protein